MAALAASATALSSGPLVPESSMGYESACGGPDDMVVSSTGDRNWASRRAPGGVVRDGFQSPTGSWVMFSPSHDFWGGVVPGAKVFS